MGTIPRLCKYKKIKDFAWKSFILSGGQTRNRTRDTRIFSFLAFGILPRFAGFGRRLVGEL